MRRTTAPALAVLLGLVLLTGCGDEQPAPGADAPSAAGSASASSDAGDGDGTTAGSAVPSEGANAESPDAADAGTTIEIEVQGDDVTPNGERIEVGVDAPIRLAIIADAPGEIHVHSTPEQEYDYPAGSSSVDLTPIARPGIVDVESHTLDKTIVQLQVQ